MLVYKSLLKNTPTAKDNSHYIIPRDQEIIDIFERIGKKSQLQKENLPELYGKKDKLLHKEPRRIKATEPVNYKTEFSALKDFVVRELFSFKKLTVKMFLNLKMSNWLKNWQVYA